MQVSANGEKPAYLSQGQHPECTTPLCSVPIDQPSFPTVGGSVMSGILRSSTAPVSVPVSSVSTRSYWPWVGVLAGAGGLIGTALTDLHVDTGGAANSAAIVNQVSQSSAHLGVVVGYITVALLLVLAAGWRGSVERRLPDSLAARVVTHGFVASAGALMLGYGWKGALALYLPDGNEPGSFDDTGLYVYYMLNDFGAYIGWLGVVIGAGAMAWMGLKDRDIPLWIGIFSCLPVLGVCLATGITGLPGFPALMAVPWLVIAFAGLGIHNTFGNTQ
jgi:hypothetical protein